MFLEIEASINTALLGLKPIVINLDSLTYIQMLERVCKITLSPNIEFYANFKYYEEIKSHLVFVKGE